MSSVKYTNCRQHKKPLGQGHEDEPNVKPSQMKMVLSRPTEAIIESSLFQAISTTSVEQPVVHSVVSALNHRVATYRIDARRAVLAVSKPRR